MPCLSIYTIEQIADMRQRRITTKSHYKMTCECCGKTIHRGDEITQMIGSMGRMRVRHCRAPVRHGDIAWDVAHAPSYAESGSYTPYAYAPTRNKWVHLTCRPQYFKNWGNGSVGFFPYPTAYSQNIQYRRSAADFDPDCGEDLSDIPYPEWKWYTQRLAAAIIPLQQNWKRKNKQRKWEKSVIDATKILDNAAAEVSYDWDKALLNYVWEIVRGERMPGSLPPTTTRNISRPERGAQLEWGTKMMQAGWWLHHTLRNKEHYWQQKLINKIIKVNIITGKPRTPLI